MAPIFTFTFILLPYSGPIHGDSNALSRFYAKILVRKCKGSPKMDLLPQTFSRQIQDLFREEDERPFWRISSSDEPVARHIPVGGVLFSGMSSMGPTATSFLTAIRDWAVRRLGAKIFLWLHQKAATLRSSEMQWEAPDCEEEVSCP